MLFIGVALGPAGPAITISKELHYGCARDLTLNVQPNYLHYAGSTLSARVFICYFYISRKPVFFY